MARETKIPKGALCECVECRTGCSNMAPPEGQDGCPNKAVVLVFDGPGDEFGTALCAECASGGE